MDPFSQPEVPTSTMTSHNGSTIDEDDVRAGEAMFYIAILTSGISIISAGIVIYIFQRYRNRDVQSNLIKYLTFANGLTCVGIVLGTFHYEPDIHFADSGYICIVQSTICTYFDMTADILTLCVIINHCSETAYNSTWMQRGRCKLIYLGFAICTPGKLLSILVL